MHPRFWPCKTSEKNTNCRAMLAVWKGTVRTCFLSLCGALECLVRRWICQNALYFEVPKVLSYSLFLFNSHNPAGFPGSIGSMANLDLAGIKWLLREARLPGAKSLSGPRRSSSWSSLHYSMLGLHPRVFPVMAPPEVVFRSSLRSGISADHQTHPGAERVCSPVQKASFPGWFCGPQAGL